MNYETFVKTTEEIVPEEIVEIGGVLFEVLDTFVLRNMSTIRLELRAITVINEQERAPSSCDAAITFPRDVKLKVMR